MVRGLVAPGLADSEINVVCRGPVNWDVSSPWTKSFSRSLKESAGGSGRSDGGAVTSARQDQ